MKKHLKIIGWVISAIVMAIGGFAGHVARIGLPTYDPPDTPKITIRGTSIMLKPSTPDNTSINHSLTGKSVVQVQAMFGTALLQNMMQNENIHYLSRRSESKNDPDLALKKKDIYLLNQKSQAQFASISKSQTEYNALMGAGLLILLLAILYNYYHLKSRNNLQLQSQQQIWQARNEEIYHKNSTLELLLVEKEWHLKEIIHRVTNNLQVVMSLLNSQAASLQDQVALAAIQESQHRVQAMALIHQKLYQAESLTRIPMPSYIEEIVTYLNDSYHLHQPINFDLTVEDIELDVTLAVPLGLIINEAITNAFKYAFPNGRTGKITVSLHQLKHATYTLTVADNGVGLPVGYDLSLSRSLGMTLIHGFSAQLGGELSIASSSGLSISVVFQEDLPSKSFVSSTESRTYSPV